MTLEVLNPATGEAMAEVAESSVEDVERRGRSCSQGAARAGPPPLPASAPPRC